MEGTKTKISKRVLFLAVLLFSIDTCLGQSIMEQMVNTTNPKSLSAVNVVYGVNLKISIQVQVIWGENIDVFTMDKANYAKFTEMQHYDPTSLNCNYTTFVNASSDVRIDVMKNGSSIDCQGFQAKDVPVGDGPVYVVVGFRDRWCKCPSCYASCGGPSPAPQCARALIKIKVDVAPALDDRIRNLIAIGAVLVLLCGGLGACQFVYNQRQKAKEREQREADTLGDDMLGESIGMTELDSNTGRRKMNRL